MISLLVVIIVVGLVVVSLFCRHTIRQISKPLSALALSADEVAKGNFDAPLPDIVHKDEVCQLRDSFATMQHSLTQYMNDLERTTAQKTAIDKELKIAYNIQMSMIPRKYPPFPNRHDIDIYGHMTPAKSVGGDLFDFHIRNERLFFCIGDVSGKGVPASLVMAVTKTQFRAASAHESNAVRIMELMNESMTKSNESSMFVTLFIGVLDLPTGRLRYCNAGHERPLLIGQASEGEQLNTVGELPVVPNIPLGIMADFKFKGQETTIRPHTNIFLYTDGLSEAEDIAHNQFGDERVIEVAKKASDDNFEGILKPNEDCILRSMRLCWQCRTER